LYFKGGIITIHISYSVDFNSQSVHQADGFSPSAMVKLINHNIIDY